MSTVLSSKSIRAIEKGIREGRCMTVIPDPQGRTRVIESEEFLSPEESEELLHSLSQPTPGAYLDMFIWEFADGNVKRFAAKIDYHPNRISTLKSSTAPLSPRLFHRMMEAYKLNKSERDFWGKGLLGV